MEELLARLRGENPKPVPETENDESADKTARVVPFARSKRSAIATSRTRQQDKQLSLFSFWDEKAPRQVASTAKEIINFQQMIEALGYYSGHHRADGRSPTNSRGEALEGSRADRSVEWYRTYGWRF